MSSIEERSAQERRCLGLKGEVGGVEADGVVEYARFVRALEEWRQRAAGRVSAIMEDRLAFVNCLI